VILLISASQVAKITGVIRQLQAAKLYFSATSKALRALNDTGRKGESKLNKVLEYVPREQQLGCGKLCMCCVTTKGEHIIVKVFAITELYKWAA
jgi:hypothetical protein